MQQCIKAFSAKFQVRRHLMQTFVPTATSRATSNDTVQIPRARYCNGYGMFAVNQICTCMHLQFARKTKETHVVVVLLGGILVLYDVRSGWGEGSPQKADKGNKVA